MDPRFAPGEFVDFAHTKHQTLFEEGEPIWAAIGRIKAYLAKQVSGQNLGQAQVSDLSLIHI